MTQETILFFKISGRVFLKFSRQKMFANKLNERYNSMVKKLKIIIMIERHGLKCATIHSLVGTEQSLKTTTATSRTHELKHEYTCMYRSGYKPLVIILMK